jgi:inner membrane protein
MHARGHKGIALLLYAPITYILLTMSRPFLAVGGLVVVLMLSMLPDIDMVISLLKHRGSTHTVWFAIAVGIGLVGLVLGIVYGINSLGIVAVAVPAAYLLFVFGVGFLGILYHIIGDATNQTGVRPWWPLSNRKYALKVSNSDSKIANWAYYIIGLVANIGAVALALQQHLLV